MKRLLGIALLSFILLFIASVFILPLFLAKYPLSAKAITVVSFDKTKHSEARFAEVEQQLNQMRIGSLSLRIINQEGKVRHVQLGESFIDKVLAKLSPNNLVFSSKFVLGENQESRLVLDTDHAIGELRTKIKVLSHKTGIPIHVADYISGSFNITGLTVDTLPPNLDDGRGLSTPSNEKISLHDEENLSWYAFVTPMGLGKQQLSLALFAYFDDFEKNIAHNTFAKNLDVDVIPQQYLSALVTEHWLWLCGVLFIPTTLWLGIWVVQQQNSKKETSKA